MCECENVKMCECLSDAALAKAGVCIFAVQLTN